MASLIEYFILCFESLIYNPFKINLGEIIIDGIRMTNAMSYLILLIY